MPENSMQNGLSKRVTDPASAEHVDALLAPVVEGEQKEKTNNEEEDELFDIEIVSHQLILSAVSIPTDMRALDACAICKMRLADPPLGTVGWADGDVSCGVASVREGETHPPTSTIHSGSGIPLKSAKMADLAAEGVQEFLRQSNEDSYLLPTKPQLRSSSYTSCSDEAHQIDEVLVSTGACGHRFHTHCIQECLRTKAGCLLCGREWHEPQPPQRME